MLNLVVVVGSSRPGRVGPVIASWFESLARQNGGFHVGLADLGDMDLPVFNEPAHPRTRQYAHEKTRAWSQIVDQADAFVFVAPEYNFGPAPALLNALTFLYHEWNYKPAGFVSYGGDSGGVRGVQAVKLALTTLKVVPLVESVVIQRVGSRIGQDRVFVSDESHQKAAAEMLDELAAWATALRRLRRERKGGTE